MSDFSNVPGLARTYEIGERLGEGGYGVVVKAYHKNLRKAVVIKESKLVVSEAKARAEVDILKDLHHPNLPQVYDFFIDNGKAYTVMDFIDGESVGSMLKRGYKFSSKEVYKYAKLLLQAVDHLHSQKIPIIHGDIKPDNIMITPDGNLCLIDFNISGVSDNGRAYTTGFTRGYGAPEQERAFIEVAKKIKEAKKALILETVQAESTGKLSDNPKREMISDRENGKPADSDEATEYEVGEDTETIELAGNAKQNSHISASFEDKSLTGNNPSLSNSNSSIKYPYSNKQSISDSYGIKLEIPIDKRSDVYSVGATIYRMYTGQYFNADKAAVLKSNTSEAFLYVLNKALQADPNKRFQSGGEMLRAVEQIYKKDRSYRGLVIRTAIVRTVLVAGIIAGIILAREGINRKGDERQDEYFQMIEQMETIRSDNQTAQDAKSENDNDLSDVNRFDSIYENAVSMFPDREEAYFEKAVWLYETGQYSKGIDFITDLFQYKSIDFDTDTRANMYYLLGNCYYELGNGDQKNVDRLYMEKAAEAFENSISYNDSNPNVYIDYAITLSDLEKDEESEKVLNSARYKGAANADLLLTQGDIGLKKLEKKEGDVDDIDAIAEAVLNNYIDCINETSDDYTCFRACIGAGKVYKIRISCFNNGIGASSDDQINDRVKELIEKQLTLFDQIAHRLPSGYRPQLYEYMVSYYNDAFLITHNAEYDDRAVLLVNNVIEMGYATLQTYENLCNIYRRHNEYEKAVELLRLLEQYYPGNYRIYMLFANVSREIENTRPENERDYSGFVEYFNKAEEAYKAIPYKNDIDGEMDVLRMLYKELRDAGWIS